MPVLLPTAHALTEATPPKSWPATLLALVTARRAPSLATHCLLAWPMALLPSLAFAVLAYGVMAVLGVDTSSFKAPDRQLSLKELFGAVIFAPLVETLLLGSLLWLLGLLSRRPLFIAAASSMLWGGLHGAFGLLWFFGTFWSFYVLSCAYLAWRPLGFGRAFAVAAVPHALVNLTMMALLFLDS